MRNVLEEMKLELYNVHNACTTEPADYVELTDEQLRERARSYVIHCHGQAGYGSIPSVYRSIKGTHGRRAADNPVNVERMQDLVRGATVKVLLSDEQPKAWTPPAARGRKKPWRDPYASQRIGYASNVFWIRRQRGEGTEHEHPYRVDRLYQNRQREIGVVWRKEDPATGKLTWTGQLPSGAMGTEEKTRQAALDWLKAMDNHALRAEGEE